MQDFGEGAFELGVRYDTGQGLRQDHAQAAFWYSQAAACGLASAQYNLGICYDIGEGVPQNYNLAVQWYTKAAAQGHRAAQCSLAMCYYNGHGVAEDSGQAVEWLKRAAQRGDAFAQYLLCMCRPESEPGQIAEQGSAWKYLLQAAEQGHSGAEYELGLRFRDGLGVPRDLERACTYLSRAAECGDPAARSALEGLKQNTTRSKRRQMAARKRRSQHAKGLARITGPCL